ncbi:unnamed protein product [Vitrella brassicaformis CCMP3155]|uniref:Uncharacterized protein n=1 Tax=Vitrella brassicaformis (strain CCMP3155) TaxID=1169540 RepID=A0A0G4GX17_VITBC|nr:unnamed protein product [Vitrella brassicaformis CCMP3155]|eukprot:CEM35595.1 unnamed protein product [Vitrella brassicaformis CCMP3155]
MPREVGRVKFSSGIGRQEMVGVLEALGAGREVHRVQVGGSLGGDQVSVTQSGAFDGWGSSSLPANVPAIGTLQMYLSVPDGLEPFDAAERIRRGLTSLLNAGVRGLGCVTLDLPGWSGANRSGELLDAIRQLLPNGMRVGDFTIISFTYDAMTRQGMRVRADLKGHTIRV